MLRQSNVRECTLIGLKLRGTNTILFKTTVSSLSVVLIKSGQNTLSSNILLS